MFPRHRCFRLAQRLATGPRLNPTSLWRSAALSYAPTSLSAANHFDSRSPWARPAPIPATTLILGDALKHFHSSALLLSSDKKEEKVSIVKKFKQMFKDYWYVLVPVHCFTSVFWFGGFYFMCKSGVDVPAVLEWFGTSPEYLEKLQNSNYAYYAMAYACYKVATPARYTVTVGGTTVSIKYLSEWGYLKSSSQIASNMKSKASNIKSKGDDLKDKLEDGYEKGKEKLEKGKERFQDKMKKKH